MASFHSLDIVFGTDPFEFEVTNRNFDDDDQRGLVKQIGRKINQGTETERRKEKWEGFIVVGQRTDASTPHEEESSGTHD